MATILNKSGEVIFTCPGELRDANLRNAQLEEAVLVGVDDGRWSDELVDWAKD
jgi:hypothetical protein